MTIRFIFFAALLIFARATFAVEDGMSSYRLGAGDVISIIVFDEKELSLEKVKLSDAGSISYPMLGELRVLGLTVSDLQQKVTAGLKGTYLINPKVTVSVDQYRDVFVHGHVNRPGNFPYQPGLTVRQAVSIAGGFKERANQESFPIIHANQDALAAVKGELSTLVAPGDTITVQETQYRDVFVNGQVNKPGNYPYQPGLTVLQAVSIAGGFKDRASKNSVSIIHDKQGKPVAIKSELGALVEPGDTITVEESFF